MNIPVTSIAKPIISKLLALQSFFFSRPRIDVDLISNEENLYGQKSLGLSLHQNHPEPIPIPYIVYDFEFHWNYKLRIKNNSSKTAYNIKIEKIVKNASDYLERIDDLATLKENEIIQLDYVLRFNASKNGQEVNTFLKSFPGHLDKIEIIVSYSNEARKRFYTKFILTPETKTNEHLLSKPK